MKFGESLHKRSIPAWQTHNIDYHDIKQFIKERTTLGKGKPLTIPGSPDTNAEDFERRLFLILQEQDERITWFVRSKVGEIHRRLDHLERQISRFLSDSAPSPRKQHTLKQRQRYGKIESDILKVGLEIQALSRFIVVQQEAFRKLIKKYKKWTGSSQLGARFNDEIKRRSSDFTQTDLKPYLEHYEELLQLVRKLYEESRIARSSAVPDKGTLTGQKHLDECDDEFNNVRTVIRDGKHVDFDHLIASSKLDRQAPAACYWVHADNLVELQILLTHYARSLNTASRQPSVASIHSGRSSPNLPNCTGTTDTFDIISDNAERFLHSRNGASTAALHARGTANDDVAVLSWISEPRQGSLDRDTCAIKRKCVDSLLRDRSNPSLARKASISQLSKDGVVTESMESIQRLQKWLKGNGDVSPLAAVLSKRSRFFELANNPSGYILASLDQNIRIESGVATESSSSNSQFPHGVLQVRQGGAPPIDLLEALDKSHLVERVDNFSLEYHAVWHITQPKDISEPTWISLLSRDLRKVPVSDSRRLNKASTEFASQSTTPRMSTTTSSDGGGRPDSSSKMFQPPNYDGAASPRRKRRSQGARTPLPNYWNEYDDPSDDEDGYYVLIDPNAQSFFGRAWSACKRGLGLTTHDVEAKPENEPLLGNDDLEGVLQDGYESSDDEAEPVNYRISRIYGPGQSAATITPQRESLLLAVPRVTLACFAASVAILVVAFILATTSKRKFVKEVDAGIIFAIVTSMTFSISGVASLYRSGRRIGSHLRGLVWVLTGIVFCAVAVCSGALIAWTFA